ncbi:hypothetical protein [Streptosporangium sp. OZ121]|uniref:hypothetical protein n=1 Tax=Streptosporangium sp. OZ121 TaxID=3444183 RepID=UPI003F791F53
MAREPRPGASGRAEAATAAPMAAVPAAGTVSTTGAAMAGADVSPETGVAGVGRPR